MTSRQMMDGLHPIGRIGTPDEVGGLIVWLSSAEAGFMTGAVVPVDGGFVAQWSAGVEARGRLRSGRRPGSHR